MKGALTLMPREDLKDGEFLTGYNTKVMIGEQELHGVASVDISYRPADIVLAKVHMYTVEQEISGGMPAIMMSHPVTGETLQVVKIEFADGSSVSFEEE